VKRFRRPSSGDREQPSPAAAPERKPCAVAGPRSNFGCLAVPEARLDHVKYLKINKLL
jgi:hypothetical protein